MQSRSSWLLLRDETLIAIVIVNEQGEDRDARGLYTIIQCQPTNQVLVLILVSRLTGGKEGWFYQESVDKSDVSLQRAAHGQNT